MRGRRPPRALEDLPDDTDIILHRDEDVAIAFDRLVGLARPFRMRGPLRANPFQAPAVLHLQAAEIGLRLDDGSRDDGERGPDTPRVQLEIDFHPGLGRLLQAAMPPSFVSSSVPGSAQSGSVHRFLVVTVQTIDKDDAGHRQRDEHDCCNWTT